MKNHKRLPYFFDEDVKLVSYCPVCDIDFKPLKLRIIANKEKVDIIHTQCNKCNSYILSLILKNHQGISSIGVITDLDYQDASKFINKKKLTTDNIINIHKTFNHKKITNILLNK